MFFEKKYFYLLKKTKKTQNIIILSKTYENLLPIAL